MEKVTEKKALLIRMANIQNKYEQKNLKVGNVQVSTQDHLARIYKNLIEKEVK